MNAKISPIASKTIERRIDAKSILKNKFKGGLNISKTTIGINAEN